MRRCRFVARMQSGVAACSVAPRIASGLQGGVQRPPFVLSLSKLHLQYKMTWASTPPSSEVLHRHVVHRRSTVDDAVAQS